MASAGRIGPTTNPAHLPRRPRASDQALGLGDGVNASFQLVKIYGSSFAPWTRTIAKPVAAAVMVAVGGVAADPLDYAVDTTTGVVTFTEAHIPGSGQAVTAGFEFDVPVRFDTDQLEINLNQIEAGSIPHIPIVEIQTMRVLSSGLQDHLDFRRHHALLVLAHHPERWHQARLHRPRPRSRFRRNELRGLDRLHRHRDRGLGRPQCRYARRRGRAQIRAAERGRSRRRPLRQCADRDLSGELGGPGAARADALRQSRRGQSAGNIISAAR